MVKHKKDIGVIDREAGELVTDSMYRYGMHVTENRALPRLEDGLKPVQRFIVWAAHEMGARKFIKSARIVGTTMSDYHPHGDASIYEALVNMTHTMCPLIEGHGNFGKPPNLPFAAARYTEARLSSLAEMLVTDTQDLDIVPKILNYDERKEFPIFLPVRLPVLLLNGSEGISVAINSNIPSHNIKEVIDAVITYVQSGNIDKAIKHIKGPDYGQGKLLSDAATIKAVYDTGDGSLEYECVFSKESSGGEKKLVITNFCPGFNPEKFLTLCEKLAEEDAIDYARNESSAKNGDKIVVVYNDDVVLNKTIIPALRKKINYKFNLLVSDGANKVKAVSMSLKDIIVKWTDARKDMIKATLEAELKRLNIELEKESGKLLAVDALDKLFQILKTTDNLVDDLVKKMKLTKLQAETVAAMRVESLQKLSKTKLEERIKGLKSDIEGVNTQLGNIPRVLTQQIKDIEKWLEKNHPELLKRGTAI